MTHISRLRAALALAALCTLTLAWGTALAQATTDHNAHHPAPPATAAATAGSEQPLSEGEVTRRDARTGKLTLRHGEIANLNMPPMTMVFTLKDPAQGNTLKPGDKVRFRAEDVNGAMVITYIEAAR